MYIHPQFGIVIYRCQLEKYMKDEKAWIKNEHKQEVLNPEYRLNAEQYEEAVKIIICEYEEEIARRDAVDEADYTHYMQNSWRR